MRYVKISLLTAAIIVTIGPASAQTSRRSAPPLPVLVCPEGKTSEGTCVNPLIAQYARHTALAFGQASLSITERVYPASSDTTYSYPNNVAATPSIVLRQTLIGGFGTGGRYESNQRGE